MKRKRNLVQDPSQMTLRLQPKQEPAKPVAALVDWSLFEQRTDRGTLMVGATVNAAILDLDQFAWSERTGVIMPRGERIHMVAWKSVLTKLNMSVGDVDRKKLLNALEKDLEGYETAQASKRTSFLPAIDPGELKSGTKNLHTTFSNHAKSNELEIGALAMAYTMDHGGDFEENKALLRTIINHPANGNVFSIGAGGAPKVRRLQSATAKATGLEAFDKTRKPRSKNKAS